MQGQQKSLGLLEYICQKVNCNYISDLCQPSCLSQIQDVVREMDQGQYDIEQWKDAVSYITKKTIEKDTADGYINYLLHLKPGQN